MIMLKNYIVSKKINIKPNPIVAIKKRDDNRLSFLLHFPFIICEDVKITLLTTEFKP